MAVAVDSNTVSYLPLTTDLTDQCGNAWVANGGAAVSGGALVLDGVDDYLTLAHFAGLAFGTTDFTIEFEAYIITNTSGVVQKGHVSGTTYPDFMVSNSSCWFGSTQKSWGTAISSDAFQHVCIMQKSKVIYGFVGGGLRFSYPNSAGVTTSSYPLYIGKNSTNVTGDYCAAHMRHFRISNIARYSIDGFTPPTFGDESLARRRQVV